nr:endothelin-converting enzyme homolog [Dermacentor andersoni]
MNPPKIFATWLLDIPQRYTQTAAPQNNHSRSLNFGAIGTVIAHEITHSFTGRGGNYDANGRLSFQWINPDGDAYKTKADCFKQQYGGITDNKANLPIDGQRTLDENLADNVGLQIALKAYNTLLKNECATPAARLEGLDHLSGTKLFFVSFGMVWCEAASAEHVKMKILRMPHSPNEYRVNIPIKNLQGFAEAFDCPSTKSNDNENKNDKCALF